jgi:hypothetical protein
MQGIIVTLFALCRILSNLVVALNIPGNQELS